MSYRSPDVSRRRPVPIDLHRIPGPSALSLSIHRYAATQPAQIFIMRAHEKFDVEGRLLHEGTRQHVQSLLGVGQTGPAQLLYHPWGTRYLDHYQVQ